MGTVLASGKHPTKRLIQLSDFWISAWQLYDIQLHALSEMRMQILLHLLTVSWQPFELILTKIFTSDAWETRFQALTRLFRIIMDITHPKFLVDGHKWQASIAPVFQFFFEALWQDNMVSWVLSPYFRLMS